ncbi:hypothetical protein BZG36_01053 [Bifiguratus adelaidae]|uniref:Non-specific serine/threonine protein kinase n=1 Tax=Bifiguratus adelaidae TaxID=1938954 RepID=A0A261Y658_9FUNG|nr:hypothetical protein BZG36_01053 [Bifiguratus adelaidae]
MANTTDVNVYAARLSDPTLDVKLRCRIAAELRDQQEVYQAAENVRFCQTLIPVFSDILKNSQPVFKSDAPEQKLRNIILEIIHRIPQNDALKEYASDLCKLLMSLLRIENEDNAVICLKTIIDLHRSFKHILEDQVQPFLDIVEEMYANMEQTVRDTFDVPGTPISAVTPGPPSLTAASPRPMSPATEYGETAPKVLAKSMSSFKVLTECPIIVVLLFQSHRKFANENLAKFVPYIVQTLSLQAKPQAEAYQAAKARGEIFTGVCPAIKNRAVYAEFIVAQVKTMSFLAYILKSYQPLLRPHQNDIPEIVIRLLRDCPPEACATRKELLVATRHILQTDFRTSFVAKIDIMLNERVLVGTGVTSHDTLRPLAYSMLADLVHHVRAELSPTQLARTIYIYSRNLHDATLAPSIQTMCAKLLLNLIDCVMKMSDKTMARGLLIQVLDAFTNKFAALNLQFPLALRQFQKRKQRSGATDAQDTSTASVPEEADDFDFEAARSIQTAALSPDATHDVAKDARFLFKNLVAGLKAIMLGLRSCNPSPPPSFANSLQAYNQFARGFTPDEVDMMIRLFREGVRCFDYYNIEHVGADNQGDNSDAPTSDSAKGLAAMENFGRMRPQSKEEKEVLDLFSVAFTLLDPAVFQEVFTSQIDYLFQQILSNVSLMHIPQYLLANDTISSGFAGIVFRFLVDRLEQLGDADPLYSSVQLRLFKLAFMAVNLFPDSNESVLQPHLSTIIMSSLKLSAKAKQPSNYFLLLRALFRSIGGGRFEILYKEVLPLLQMLLEILNSLLTMTQKQDMKELFVELCLTVPVRLSALLPYLPYLMKPLVLALQGSSEITAQGLRTLELCIDNLTSDFLDPIMTPVINDLMAALWGHLRPPPYNQAHSNAAMRILGKLGGRNRRMLLNPPKLTYETSADVDIQILFRFDSTKAQHALSIVEPLNLAIRLLKDSSTSEHYQRHAYQFLRSCLALLIDIDGFTSEMQKDVVHRARTQLPEYLDHAAAEKAQQKDSTVEETSPEYASLAINGDYEKEAASLKTGDPQIDNRLSREKALRQVIDSLMVCAAKPLFQEEATSLLQDVCRHFCLVHISEVMDTYDKLQKKRPFAEKLEEAKSHHLDTTIIVDSIADTMTSDEGPLRKVAENSLQFVYQTCATILGGKENVAALHLWHAFAIRFSSNCYKQEWPNKSAGCCGISMLSSQLDLGTKWLREHELEFIRSLLFVLKDTSTEMAAVNMTDATETLSHVLKVCNRPDDDSEIDNQAKHNQLISLLISELSNPNPAVRETIQSSLQLLADLTGSEVTELLVPIKDRLVGPIFAKPLRALPFAMQIGNIDAITYCLTLRPPFLEFNDELVRLLSETLALCDAEDQALVSRASQYKNAVALINLRIVCIKLLSAAMACNDFSHPRQQGTRARIIQVFFKSLYSKAPEVVEAAHRGLKQVLAQQHRLPRDLLQAGLRPILTTLSNYKTLTVAGLEGLARLLELLTNYFKVEIGKKLLDHLRQWADPTLLQDMSSKAIADKAEIKIIVAIANVFHLLPSAANVFLEEFVTIVLEMEANCRRSLSSPFRPPLLKFLDRYPSDSVQFFYERLSDVRMSRLFLDMVGMEGAQQLREEIAINPEELIKRTFEGDFEDHDLFGISLVNQLSQYDNQWLAQNKDVLNHLLEIWRKRIGEKRKQDDYVVPSTIREIRLLTEMLISYMKVNPDNVDVLFDLITIFTDDTVIDTSPLRQFLKENIALGYTAKQKRPILERFLANYADKEYSSMLKMMALRYLVNPMILVTVTQKKDDWKQLFPKSVMDQIHQGIWHQGPAEQADDSQYSDDSLRIELLQLTAMIVQYCPELITETDARKKDLIKFGWNYMRLEDITGKHAAYVLVARFIAAYDTPSKLVIQVYFALLRAHQLEARTLVKQALDVLTPVLPKRIPATEQDAKFPMWVRATRRVLVEDGHSAAQLINVYHLLVRHADLFFPFREHFMPQIVNTLSKLGFLQSATPETKTLTVDLAELILSWEVKRLNQSQGSEDAEVGDKRVAPSPLDEPARKRQHVDSPAGETRGVATASTTSKEYLSQLALRENVVSYLVRFACTPINPNDPQRKLVQRVLELIGQFLRPECWSDVHVKFSHLERTLVYGELNELYVPVVCNALEILKIDLQHKPVEWFLLNMHQLYRLVEPSIKNDNVKVQTALYPVLVHIFKAIDDTLPAEGESKDSVSPDITSLISLVDSVVTDGLQNLGNPYTVITLLQAMTTNRKERLDSFISGLIKLLQKLTKENIAGAPNSSQSSTAPDHPMNMLITELRLLKSRVSYLGDQRRWYLTSLIQLIEKSPDIEVARAILDLVRDWILSRTETFPTIKEKASLMVKMMLFENRNDTALIEQYLELVIQIYKDPSFARSELTVRLEHAFLMGTRSKNPDIRNAFTEIFDKSISRVLYSRLNYVIGVQNWESLAGYYWIHQALDIVMDVIVADESLSSMDSNARLRPISQLHTRPNETESLDDEEIKTLVSSHQHFVSLLSNMQLQDLLSALQQIHHLDNDVTHNLWIKIFPLGWSDVNSKERHDLTKVLTALLAKDYHAKQLEARPNVVQSLLDGVVECSPPCKLPPHLVKYLAKTYNAWHTGLEYLQNAIASTRGGDSGGSKEERDIKERTWDALAELYASLSENDMFYGSWRRRCAYTETNAAISFEENGLWMQAQSMYETAQIKARSGVLPFTESEYGLWEDHWILCTQKLQQWDILTDLAKHDGNIDLLLECAWRLSDWPAERELLEQSIQQLADSPTPRRKVFESFMALIKSQGLQGNDRMSEFHKTLEEGFSLSIKKWYSMPVVVSQSHISLLQTFQQYVELQEASQIFNSLVTTTAQTLESKSSDLKGILTTWRERLPNHWDDINVWSDLVHWRQHIFAAINRTYLPLIPMLTSISGGANASNTHSFAYRGYHETAWIINRFAHVARKHQLYDVCVNYLTKIYTLPNIEIQEAFLKLREQAKCYYQNSNELTAGLDVINNTNLVYFTPQQKAEFFTLKGMFLAKLNHYNDANESFVSAVQIDISLAKAWAAWGKYNDQRFRENPREYNWANNAVSSYLQAAAIYKSAKSRKYLIRILWLLSLDDAQGTISRAFENFKTELPVWYWITFIPQLLASLRHKESKHARTILTRIAKSYPQALHFQLRTQREEYLIYRKQFLAANGGVAGINSAAATANGQALQNTTSNANGTEEADSSGAVKQSESATNEETKDDVTMGDDGEDKSKSVDGKERAGEPSSQNDGDMEVDEASKASGQAKEGVAGKEDEISANVKSEQDGDAQNVSNSTAPQGEQKLETAGAVDGSVITPGGSQSGQQTSQTPQAQLTHPWDLVDDIMSKLKTAFPLLALTMETMIDQLLQKMKPQAEEDIYRLIVALYNDAIQQMLGRLTLPNDTGALLPVTEANIARFAENFPAGHMKTAFAYDFILSKPTLPQYVAKLRVWRNKLEALLDRRARQVPLELVSHYLVEFQHQKFDEVEVPGQYLMLKDSAADFLRIDRFMPEVRVTRSFLAVHRQFTIRGHDGSLHPFTVHQPTPRLARREERIVQMFRVLSGVLERRKESRMRNLTFHLPAIVPLAPQLRIIQDDPSYATLQDIYEDYCKEVHMHKDDPIMYFIDRVKSTLDLRRLKTELLNLRMEIGDEISSKMVPATILSNYMSKTMKSYTDLWMVRKQFTSQLATSTFMTYIMSVGQRQPHKLYISRATGNVWISELLPIWNAQQPVFGTGESVPFRFTPNLQNFITPVGVEGLFTTSLMAVARCLTEPEFDLDQYLNIFIRDEIVSWHEANQKPLIPDQTMRDRVAQNLDYIIKKTQFLSCKLERDKSNNTNKPANQSIIDLISQASNGQKLAQMECTWMPWL